MTNPTLLGLAAEGGRTLYLLVFLLTPYAAYALVARSASPGVRLAAIACFLGLVWLTTKVSPPAPEFVASYVLGLGYFVILAIAVWHFQRLLAPPHCNRAGLLALAGTLFVAVPAIALPGPLSFAIQLKGWELMFKAYSFCADAGSSKVSWTRALFFFLVDPVLVFPERAKDLNGQPALWQSSRRCLIGFFMLALHGTAFFSVDALLSAWSKSPFTTSYLFVGSYYLARLLIGYWAHAGRASFEIGLMGLLGYSIPERYLQPLYARSPLEFWRRWNTYVGSWFRRYVFFPAAVGWHRPATAGRFPVMSSMVSKSLAVLATFLLTGLLHDYSTYLRFGTSELGMLACFALNGVAILVWVGVAKLLRTTIPRRILLLRPVRATISVISYVAFVHLLILSAALAIPRLPLPLPPPGPRAQRSEQPALQRVASVGTERPNAARQQR